VVGVLGWAAICAAGKAVEPDRDTWKADTRAAIPKIAKAPVCDGKVRPAEWSAALRYDGVLNPVSLNLFPRSAVWYLAWDAAHLYVASRTRLLTGEKPKQDVEDDDASQRDLRLDDSMEIRLSPAGSRAALHLIVTPRGKTYCRISGVKNPEALERAVSAAAGIHDGFLDFEVRIPVASLGVARASRAGDVWRIMLVRNFRAGASLQSSMPNGFQRSLSNIARHPVFALTDGGPFVRFANPRKGLYAGRAPAAVEIVNPSRKPRKLRVRFRVADSTRDRFTSTTVVNVPAAGSRPVKIDGRPTPPINPKTEAQYRYEITIVAADGAEVFHTHFSYDPTDSLHWLGDKMPTPARRGERVLLIEPHREGIPFKFQRPCARYKDLPKGHKIRLVVRRLWEPSKLHHIDAVQTVMALDPEGRKHGVEMFYGTYGYALKRTVSWKHGVRHGPEETMAYGRRGRYVRRSTPWNDGVVDGVKRAYHPNGKVMTEVTYRKGKPVGKSTSYDGEGMITRTVEYKRGLRDGVMTDYWPRKPRRVVPYVKGEVHGIVREFHENGRLRSERPFRRDVLQGVEKQYDEDGEQTRTRYWIDGDAVSEDEYNKKFGQ